MKQRASKPLTELFGFGKKKRTYYVGIYLPGYHSENDDDLNTISKTVRTHLKYDSRVKSVKYKTGKELRDIFTQAGSRPYEGYEFVCAESDFSAVKRRVADTALLDPSLHTKSQKTYDAYGIDRILLWHTGKVIESLDEPSQELEQEQREDPKELTELFGFGKKKRLQCIIVVADDVPNMSDYSLSQISKNVEEALKTDNRVQDLEAFYRDADSLPVAKEAYSGRARAVFMYTCATYDDYDAVEARVRTWAVDGFVWSSKVDYYKKLRNILHFDIVLPDTRKKESFEQGDDLMKDNIWEALDELYEDMPQPVDYSGMPEAQLIKIAYDLGKQSSELINKIRYHQAAQGPSYWAQRGALQKAQKDFDAMSEQYDAVEAQLVKRGLGIWSTVNSRQISIVVVGVDANDAIKISPDLTIYKYCVDQSGKLVNLLNRPAYYLPPTIDNLCMPYLIASTEAAHPGATCKLVPAQVIRDGCIAYEQKTKSFAIYTMADTLSEEVAALLPAGYTGVVYLGSGANTLSSEPEFRRDDHVHFGLFKRNATLEGQVDRRPIRKFTEFAYLANNAVAPKAAVTFNVDIKDVRPAAQAAQTRQHAQWQAEYDQQRRQARNAKARERRAALKAKANAVSATDDIVQ